MHLLNTVAFATLASAGIVSIPFKKGQVHHEKRSLRHLRIRDDKPVTLPALNNITAKAYYTELEIGTPPQKLSFLLDTGSSDTWMNSVNSDACDEPVNPLQESCQTPCKSNSIASYSRLLSVLFSTTVVSFSFACLGHALTNNSQSTPEAPLLTSQSTREASELVTLMAEEFAETTSTTQSHSKELSSRTSNLVLASHPRIQI